MTRFFVALAGVLLLAAVGCTETTQVTPLTAEQLAEEQAEMEAQVESMVNQGVPTGGPGEVPRPTDPKNPTKPGSTAPEPSAPKSTTPEPPAPEPSATE